jgi:shikimate dehydrogenase
MQRYALVGSPISHSLSPRMQAAAFAAAGIPATYEAFDARDAEAIFALLREQGFSGWNVTTPLKEHALRCVDVATPAAVAAGAVNVVRRRSNGLLEGTNTDGAGLLAALRDIWQWEPRGAIVLMLGSGPAARAVALALSEAGAEEVWCWSRRPDRARIVGPPPAGRPDLVVSALPADAVLPPAVGDLVADAAYAFDLNYGVKRSPLNGAARGLRSDGLPLLLHQGALSFTWWTGRPAPLEAMRAALAAARP